MKKKSNVLKRNSGFIVGCVLAAGVSAIAANTVMTNGVSVLLQETETMSQEETAAQTVAEETAETRIYETDPFTVTASGNILKGAETENETEPETPKETEKELETDENGNPVSEALQSDEDGTVISGSVDSRDNSSSGSSYYEDGSSSGGDSGSSDSSGDSYTGETYYDGPAIEIYDTGNGDYYYTDDSGSSDNSGSSGSSGSAGGSGSGGISSVVTTDFWSDSVFPETNCRYIDESELYIYSASEIRLIRNEIFARHGRIFDSSDLANYFNGKAWYVPTYSPEEFDAHMDSFLNDYEKANLQVILNYEDALAGY